MSIAFPRHVFALLALLLAGCEPARDALPPAAPQHELTLALNDSYLGSGLVYLARARGYLAEEGVALRLLPMSNGRDALQAMLDGRAGLANVATTPLAVNLAQEKPIKILATMFHSPATHAVLVRSAAGIADVAGLAGKRLGVSVGTDGHYALALLLASHGVDITQLDLLDLPPAALLRALADGEVDAIATWEPWLSDAQAQAPAGSLLRFSGAPGFPQGFHLVARSDVVATRQPELRALLRALRRARDAIETEPAQALADIADAMQRPLAALGSGSSDFRFELRLSQGLLPMLEGQARWARSAGLLPPVAEPDFLDAIHFDALLAVDPDAVSVVR